MTTRLDPKGERGQLKAGEIQIPPERWARKHPGPGRRGGRLPRTLWGILLAQVRAKVST